MNKVLVAYFSATGRTAKAAARLAKLCDADIYEIKPVVKYQRADLNWMNKNSRTTIEMHNKASRPAIITGDLDLTPYDTIYLGFPIWWYVAPTLINTFLEAYDFNEKRIIVFATSGGSGFGDTVAELEPSAPGAEIVEGCVLSGLGTENKLLKLLEL